MTRLDFILRYAQGNVLNVGAASEAQYLQTQLSHLPAVTDLTGIDIVQAPGLTVHDIQEPMSETFDTVVLGEVLEHLADPMRALTNIHGHCHRLILTTPNPLARTMLMREGPDHLFYTTVKSLRNVRETAKFKSVTEDILPYERRGKRLVWLRNAYCWAQAICQVWEPR